MRYKSLNLKWKKFGCKFYTYFLFFLLNHLIKISSLDIHISNKFYSSQIAQGKLLHSVFGHWAIYFSILDFQSP